MASLGQALSAQQPDGSNPPPQAAPQPGPDDTGGAPASDLAGQWSDWLGKPTNRAALMQFGVAMLQPVRQGETGTSHFANSIAYGGEAANTVQNEALKEKQVDDASTLKSAQAQLASERASVVPQLATAQSQAAEARAEAAGARAQVAPYVANANIENQRTLRSLQENAQYQTYVQQAAKQNSDPLNTEGPKPIMDKETWAASQGLRGPAPGANVGLPVVPPGQGTKPTSDALIKSSPNLQALIKLPDGDPRKAAAIERARTMVADPQVFDKMVKGQ